MFFSLLVIAVAFLPVFTLVDQEGRLFKPLAYTKTLAMAIAALLAITLDPAMRMLFTRMDPFTFRPRWLSWLATKALVGTYYPEEKHPISRVLFAVYEPACRFVLRFPKTRDRARRSWLRGDHRPGLLPARARSSCRRSTRAPSSTCRRRCPGSRSQQAAAAAPDAGQASCKSFPEVRARLRQGRARRDVHRPGAVLDDGDHGGPQARGRSGEAKPRWYSSWAPGLVQGCRAAGLARPHLAGTSWSTRWTRRCRSPGVTNAWTMPIKARIDMLSTGVRTPVGIKIFGADLEEIERIGEQLEAHPARRPGHAQRVRRARDRRLLRGLRAAARRARPLRPHDRARCRTSSMTRDRRRERHHHGRGPRALPRQRPLPAGAARQPGPARGACSCRRPAAPRSRWRSSPTSSSSHGPAMIRDENGLLAGYVYVDIAGRDVGGYVEEAKRVGARQAQRCRRATCSAGAASTRT